MAFGTPVHRGILTVQLSGGSTAPSITATVPVGRILVVWCVTDNTGTADGATTQHSACSDTKNTYTKLIERTETDGVAGDGCCVSVWWTRVTTQLTTSDAVTVTHGTVTARIVGVIEIPLTSDTGYTVKVDGSIGVGQGSLTAATSGLTSREHCNIYIAGAEGGDASKTAPTNFTEMSSQDVRTGSSSTSSVSGYAAHRINTSTGESGAATSWTGTSYVSFMISFYEYQFIKGFSDTLGLTSLTSTPKLNKTVNVSDTLGLTSLTSTPKLNRSINFSDTLALSSLTSNVSLSVGTIYNFADTLALTSLTSTPSLNVITQYNFTDTLALSSLTSTPKLNRIFAFSDSLVLDSLTSTPKLNKEVTFSDTLGLTSLTSTPVLIRLMGFSDTLDLTSLTSTSVLSVMTVKNFSDTLALTSLTSIPKLFREVNFSDTLALTSLTSNVSMYREVFFSDTLALSSLTSTPALTLGTVYNFSDTLALTSLTSNPKLYREIAFADTLNLTSLTSNPTLTISGIINFTDTLSLTSLTSTPELKILVEQGTEGIPSVLVLYDGSIVINGIIRI